jgi:hypothetical protein
MKPFERILQGKCLGDDYHHALWRGSDTLRRCAMCWREHKEAMRKRLDYTARYGISESWI